MSKLEVDENNCILSDNDLINVDTALFMMGATPGCATEESKSYLEILFQKINKLNNLAKEKSK